MRTKKIFNHRILWTVLFFTPVFGVALYYDYALWAVNQPSFKRTALDYKDWFYGVLILYHTFGVIGTIILYAIFHGN